MKLGGSQRVPSRVTVVIFHRIITFSMNSSVALFNYPRDVGTHNANTPPPW